MAFQSYCFPLNFSLTSCHVGYEQSMALNLERLSQVIICDIPNLRMLRLYTAVVDREALLVQQKYIQINLNCFSIATGYGLNGLCSIPGGGKRFFSSTQCEDWSWGPPSFVPSNLMGVTMSFGLDLLITPLRSLVIRINYNKKGKVVPVLN
jgi:hypothetical protein